MYFGHFFQLMKSEHYHSFELLSSKEKKKAQRDLCCWESKEVEGTETATKCQIIALGQYLSGFAGKRADTSK